MSKVIFVSNSEKRRKQTQLLVLGAVFTALVAVLQTIGGMTTFFGPFSTAVALVPIILGSAMCGSLVGAWLGFVFGFVVLVTGGATLFWMFNIPGTIITVLVKGTLCGLAAGLVYKLLSRFNEYVAVIVAAIVCPVVNTGIFLLGSRIFFLEYATAIAVETGLKVSGMSVFYALATANFLTEIGTSVILAPVLKRVLKITKSN